MFISVTVTRVIGDQTWIPQVTSLRKDTDVRIVGLGPESLFYGPSLVSCYLGAES